MIEEEIQQEIDDCTEELRQNEMDINRINKELISIKHINCPLIKQYIEQYMRKIIADIEYNTEHIQRLNNLLDLQDED